MECGLVDGREVRIDNNTNNERECSDYHYYCCSDGAGSDRLQPTELCQLLNLPPGSGPHFLIIFQYLLELNRNFYTETFQ